MNNLFTGYDYNFSQSEIGQSVSAGLFASLSYRYDLLQNQSAILRAKWRTLVQTTRPTDNMLYAIILVNFPESIHLTTI